MDIRGARARRRAAMAASNMVFARLFPDSSDMNHATRKFFDK
jgi:hypothetical protein